MSKQSPRPRDIVGPVAAVLVLLFGFFAASCSAHDDSGSPCGSPSCLELRLDDSQTPLQRAPARFEHRLHVETLGANSCVSCHAKPSDGDFALRDVKSADRSARTDEIHRLCMGCHQQRQASGQKTGPELCGQCHRGAVGAAAAQAPVAMDLSLHQRHVASHGNKCDGCHHVFDDASRKLVYRKGQEGGCRDCHKRADDGRKLSWRHAAHGACVGCHARDAAAGGKAGPTECAGCHDAATLAAVKRLDPVPRLDRGQPVRVWMRAPWATTHTVVFDHARHEATSSACSNCHHQTLQRCEACHAAEGKPEGGNVTLEVALHSPSSTRSCVGCHAKRAAANTECAGCHDGTASGGGRRCEGCHAGGDHARARTDENLEVAGQELAALPGSPDLPDKDLELGDLKHLYQAAKLPHPRIIARLDKAVRASRLASHFHGRATTLCEGCHHHEAQDAKASRCASCHGRDEDERRDKPSALHAYHRQCVNCHERMGIQAVGCTDCHAKAEAKQ